MRMFLVTVLVICGCGRDGLMPNNNNQVPAQPDAGTIIESPGMPVFCGATPCTQDGGYKNDAGRRIGVVASTTNCAEENYWVFPDEQSTYCGAILDACQFICGTTRECTIDVVPPSNLHTAYCPGENSPPKVGGQ